MSRKKPPAADDVPVPDDDRVGYGRPPKAHRFKPGQSGNPSGRPKGSISMAALLRKALIETVEITINGRTRRVRKVELAIKQLVNKAAKGDARALNTILAMAPSLEAPAAGASSPLDADETQLLQDLFQEIRHGA
jgi:hypothetical protein